MVTILTTVDRCDQVHVCRRVELGSENIVSYVVRFFNASRQTLIKIIPINMLLIIPLLSLFVFFHACR